MTSAKSIKCLKKIEFHLKMKIEDNKAPSLMKMEEKMHPSLIENPRHNKL